MNKVCLTLLGAALWLSGPPDLSLSHPRLIGVTPAQATAYIDIGYFYRALAPYGKWIHLKPYGWVWYPNDIPVGWRPYTDGHWLWTDAFGWTWVSARPWGWAPFHYGRWFRHSHHGWVWVPGTVWGPAWVSWRFGPGFIGWAPLPPTVRFIPGHGLSAHVHKWERELDWRCWSFVPQNRFLDQPLERAILASPRNREILDRTYRAARHTAIGNSLIDKTLPIERIESVTGRRITRYAVSETARPEARSQVPPRSSRLVLFKPAVLEPAAGTAPAGTATLGRASTGESGGAAAPVTELTRPQRDPRPSAEDRPARRLSPSPAAMPEPADRRVFGRVSPGFERFRTEPSRAAPSRPAAEPSRAALNPSSGARSTINNTWAPRAWSSRAQQTLDGRRASDPVRSPSSRQVFEGTVRGRTAPLSRSPAGSRYDSAVRRSLGTASAAPDGGGRMAPRALPQPAMGGFQQRQGSTIRSFGGRQR